MEQEENEILVLGVRTGVVHSANGVCLIVTKIIGKGSNSGMFSMEEIYYTEKAYDRENGSHVE